MVKLEYLEPDRILVEEGVHKTTGEDKSLNELADSIACMHVRESNTKLLYTCIWVPKEGSGVKEAWL